MQSATVWPPGQANYFLDVIFILDIPIKMRTSYRDHGYDIIEGPKVARHYLRGWFAVDFVDVISAPAPTFSTRRSPFRPGPFPRILPVPGEETDEVARANTQFQVKRDARVAS